MLTENFLWFIILFFSSLGLAAQADIDLGGEDTAVGPLLPPANSQVVGPAGWLPALLNGDDLHITPQSSHVSNKYIYEVTDRPGEVIDYNKLNILFYLEDYTVFQEYFLNRVYNRKKSYAIDTDIITYFYPLVRPNIVGNYSYGDNPLHMPMIKSSLDPTYTSRFNNAATVRDLYELALEMPVAPTLSPRYLFDQSRSLFDEYVPSIIEELELTIREAMTNEYAKMNPKGGPSANFESQPWSDNDLATVVSKVSQTAIKRKEKRVIKELIAKLVEEVEALQKGNVALSTAYRYNKELLNKQEQMWFAWVMKSSNQTFLDLNVTLTYLTEVNELSSNAKNYSHLVKISHLLRETIGRIRILPKEAEAKLVLTQLTASYLTKVEADASRFNDL